MKIICSKTASGGFLSHANQKSELKILDLLVKWDMLRNFIIIHLSTSSYPFNCEQVFILSLDLVLCASSEWHFSGLLVSRSSSLPMKSNSEVNTYSSSNVKYTFKNCLVPRLKSQSRDLAENLLPAGCVMDVLS